VPNATTILEYSLVKLGIVEKIRMGNLTPLK